MRAAVIRAEQRGRPCTGEDDVGIDRIDRDPPDIEAVHRRVEAFEALSAVTALVDAVIGAREHRAGLPGMHGQPEDPAFVSQPLADAPPALAAVRAQPSAAPDRPNADREIACHGPVLPSRIAVPAEAGTHSSATHSSNRGSRLSPGMRFLKVQCVPSQPVCETSMTTPSGPAHFCSKLT